jgi:hypothetical protein
MNRCAWLLVGPLAAVLAIGCDSAIPAPARESVQASVPQTIAGAASKAGLKKKKKEPGIAPAKGARTESRPNL